MLSSAGIQWEFWAALAHPIFWALEAIKWQQQAWSSTRWRLPSASWSQWAAEHWQLLSYSETTAWNCAGVKWCYKGSNCVACLSYNNRIFPFSFCKCKSTWQYFSVLQFEKKFLLLSCRFSQHTCNMSRHFYTLFLSKGLSVHEYQHQSAFICLGLLEPKDLIWSNSLKISVQLECFHNINLKLF